MQMRKTHIHANSTQFLGNSKKDWLEKLKQRANRSNHLNDWDEAKSAQRQRAPKWNRLQEPISGETGIWHLKYELRTRLNGRIILLNHINRQGLMEYFQ